MRIGFLSFRYWSSFDGLYSLPWEDLGQAWTREERIEQKPVRLPYVGH